MISEGRDVTQHSRKLGEAQHVIFTFIIDKEGSTIIEQLVAKSLEEATLRWYRESSTNPGELLEGRTPVPIDNTVGVWCISGIDPDGLLYITNIVATRADL